MGDKAVDMFDVERLEKIFDRAVVRAVITQTEKDICRAEFLLDRLVNAELRAQEDAAPELYVDTSCLPSNTESGELIVFPGKEWFRS